MKYLLYGTHRLLVTDPVAYTLIDYAAALAQPGLADRVDVPTFDPYGYPASATVLLAPALPLLAHTAPDDELEPNPPEQSSADIQRFLHDITWRTDAVRSGTSNS